MRDPSVHEQVLRAVVGAAEEIGFGLGGLVGSPLRGPAGNREFLALLHLGDASAAVDALVEGVVPDPDGEEQ